MENYKLMEDFIYIILFLISIYFSYKYTLIENALLNLTSSKLKNMEQDGINTKFWENIKSDAKTYSTILIGDYFANGIGVLSLSVYFFNHFGKYYEFLGALISIICVIVMGESLPKRLGRQSVEKILRKNAKFIKVSNILLRPMVLFIEAISRLILTITKVGKVSEPLITEEELKDFVSLSMEEGIIDKSEVGIIENVMGFKDCFAKDIMTPRTDIVSLSLDATYDDIKNIIKEEYFSRMPVYDEDLDNIVGTLYVKDLFAVDFVGTLRDNKDILREANFTYEYKPVSSLFTEMRHKKISVSIVSDEYGGTEGMITIEDILEKIVGEINDEYDEEEDMDIIKLSNKRYLVDGSTNYEDLNHVLDTNLSSDEFDSVGGIIIEKIDRFPKKGENIEIDGINFHIEEVSKNRIDKVIVDLTNKKN